MSRAEFANRSEHSPAFHYETAVKPEIYSREHTLPSEDVSKTVSPGFEELPKAETSKSELSLGSDESSGLEETSMSQAFPGPREEAEAKGRYFPDWCLHREAAEPLQEGPVPQEEEEEEEEHPQLLALELFPSLHDPFAEVEAKLARLSSTVAGTEVLQAGGPEVPSQVTDVTRDTVQKLSRQSSAGGTQVPGHAQTSSLRCSGTSPTICAVALAWWWQAHGDWPSGVQERAALSCSVNRQGRGMEIGGFSRWPPVLLVEGHLPGSCAELPWLHRASRPGGAQEALVSLLALAGWGLREGRQLLSRRHPEIQLLLPSPPSFMF